MGNIDASCHTFLSKAENFADLCNGFFYNGRNIILPEDLIAEDSKISCKTNHLNKDNLRHNSKTRNLKTKTTKNITRFVDVIKTWTKNNTSISIIVLENQNKVDFTMPMRNMLNEAILYNNQLKNIKNKHMNYKDLTDAEFLSGISKNDIFTPVIIIVIYLGELPWDGPVCLWDMLNIDESLKPFINNYSINLLDYHNYVDFNIFSGEVKSLLTLLAARNDKNKMKDIIQSIGYTDFDTASLLCDILNIVNINKYIIESEERKTVDMCKAWEDNFNDGVIIGEERGVKIGEERGVKIGEERGLKLGEKRGKQIGREEGLKALVNSVKDLLPDFDSVYQCVIKNKPYKNLTKEDVRKYY